MNNRALQRASLFFVVLCGLLLCCGAIGQISPPVPSSAPFTSPGAYEGIIGSLVAPGWTPLGQADYDLWSIGSIAKNRSPLEGPSGSVSKLDLKAPDKARREYVRGYQLLAGKDFNGAVPHLTTAISIYPNFVAAHEALGSAYFKLGQNDLARDQFIR